jgi:hypothetical protein
MASGHGTQDGDAINGEHEYQREAVISCHAVAPSIQSSCRSGQKHILPSAQV